MTVNSSNLFKLPMDVFQNIVVYGELTYEFGLLSKETHQYVSNYAYYLKKFIIQSGFLSDPLNKGKIDDFTSEGSDTPTQIRNFALRFFGRVIGTPFGIHSDSTPLLTYKHLCQVFSGPSTPFEAVVITWRAAQKALGLNADEAIVYGIYLNRADHDFMNFLRTQAGQPQQAQVPQFMILRPPGDINRIIPMEERSIDIRSLSPENKDEYFQLFMRIIGESEDALSLDLRSTDITALHPALRLVMIRDLNCSNCRHLSEIPNNLQFSRFLTSINFSGCLSLKTIPEGIFSQEGIDRWNLSFAGCEQLTSLPDDLFTGSQMALNLEGCKNLVALPRYRQVQEGEDPCVSEINLSGCTLIESTPGWNFTTNDSSHIARNWVYLGDNTFYDPDEENGPQVPLTGLPQPIRLSIADAWRFTLSNPESTVFNEADNSLLSETLQSKIARICLCIFFTIITLGFSHLSKFFISKNLNTFRLT